MSIKRSGPPTTHDSLLWRVPLSEPPSSAWQKAFQDAGDATDNASPGRVQFEPKALTFRTTDAHVPEWVQSIDRWIARANEVEAGLESGRQQNAARAQELSDARRRKATDANERFKDL